MSLLEGINFFGEYSLDDILCHNLINYMQHGLLELGAYYNIGTGTVNYDGYNLSRLRPVNINGTPNYKVWGGASANWVWEQGINLKFASGNQPVNISGIYVNSTFYPTGSTITGTGYYIDYSRGRAVFSSPLSSGTIVSVPHSDRGVHVYSSDSNEFREVNWDWRQSPTGYMINNYNHQAYLPMISVGLLGYRTVRGVGLGTRGKVTLAEFEFTILASTPGEYKKLIDICYMLETKSVPIYDINRTSKPLNDKGQLVASGLTWPYLSNNYRMGEGRFREDCRVLKSPNNSLPILSAKVRINFEFDSYPN